MQQETIEERSDRVLKALEEQYPGAEAYDLDGLGNHFVCEVEPVKDHPEYDRAVEVIFKSTPHKHLEAKQRYTILSGTLILHVDDEETVLKKGDTYWVLPGDVHWAESQEGCWVEIYSEPGWTAADHIMVD